VAELSIIIPARNEILLEQTIRSCLANTREDLTEIIVVLDGYLPDPPINAESNRVRFIHYPEAIGQRPAINAAARMSSAKYICKLDAHCQLGPKFDEILIESAKELGRNVTQIPRMYNLDRHKFGEDWAQDCAKRPKQTDRMYIGWNDKGELRSLYYGSREAKGPDNSYIETMGCMGPCFFIDREYFWETGGCEESFGHWGSQGIEVACKAWLSGGKLITNSKTWFAHWFRGSDGGFPYPISGRMIDQGRKKAENLFTGDKWEKAVRPFQFLLDKFDPPTWKKPEPVIEVVEVEEPGTTVLYYTANQEAPDFAQKIRDKIRENSGDKRIVSVSQKPIDFGYNLHIGELGLSYDNLVLQLLVGAKNIKTKYIALAEDDFLYPKEYFDFIPEKDDCLYRADNLYLMWSRGSAYRKKMSEGAAVTTRKYLLELLTTGRYGGKQQNIDLFHTEIPLVTFKTDNSWHNKAPIDKASACREIPHYGDIDALRREYGLRQ